MNLTLNETKALYYLIEQEHLLKNDPVLKRALKSGAKKLYKNMFALRRRQIFEEGVKAAREDLRLGIYKQKANAPVELGCLEQMTWYDGYCSVDKERKNPYRNTR